jgi:hypothetical protein
VGLTARAIHESVVTSGLEHGFGWDTDTKDFILRYLPSSLCDEEDLPGIGPNASRSKPETKQFADRIAEFVSGC